MKRSLLLIMAGLVGLLCAAAIGYAAYAVSRDSVAVPVTSLQPKPAELAPKRVRTHRRSVSTTTAGPTTTSEDHHGGHGGGHNSGHGGGGGGDD